MQKGRTLLLFSLLALVNFILINTLFDLRFGKQIYTQSITNKSHAAKKPNIYSFTPSNAPTPTLSPTVTFEPVPTKILSKTQTLDSSKSLSPTDYILQKVNEYRNSFGLSKVIPNTQTCEFAKIRAQEISSLENFNHEGFTKRVNENSLPYSGYSEVTENIAYNTDYTDVVNRWINSPGHAENMRKNTQYVCIGKYGDYYTYEGWQP